jgi:class 3 adenylate cyclase/tetratricopeptide (TPR) repeat protein
LSVVTLLFTDLVGSTELLTRLGQQAFEELRRAHFALLRDALTRHGGREIKSTGDGLMVVFDSTGDAVACAISMQQAVDRRSHSAGGPPLSIRIGMDVGEPTWHEGDYFGTPVVVASRLCAIATGGQILASDVVRAIAGARGFAFKSLGALPLKGIDDPIAACEVLWEPVPAAIPLPPLFAQPDAMPFVGRAADRERLRSLFEEACELKSRLVMFAGEPGIGKTRIATEFAREVHAEGATVWYGRSDEEGLAPYQPFVEALKHYVESTPVEQLTKQLGRMGGELVRLLPDLSERVGDLPEPLSADPETERYRLFDAVAHLIQAVSLETPLVIVLDDLHWADKPTLLLLRHIVRTVGRSALMIIGTYRDVELDRLHPLADALADLRRDEGYERMLLRGLSRNEVSAFLAARAGHELDTRAQALADALHVETEGNPFFVREIIRHLVESGALYQEAGQWTSNLTVDQVGLPESIREVIGRRLARLSERCNEALRSAAAIGQTFDLAFLGRVSAIADDALIDALGEAERARLVAEVPDMVDQFAFAHALVRETLYEELPTSRRVRLHRRIGEVLEELRGEDPDPPLAELAFHFGEAAVLGDPFKAVDYARRAGARAVQLLAYEEAVLHFQRAIQTAEHEKVGGEAERLDLLIRLAEGLRLAGDIGRSKETFRQAAEIAKSLSDDDALRKIALGFGGLWVEVGVPDPFLIELIQDCLQRLPAEAETLQARLFARLAIESAFTSDRDPSRKRAFSADAVAIARRSRDASTIAYALIARRHVLAGPQDLDERLQLTREAIAVAEEAGELEYAQRARALRVIDLFEAGDIDELDRQYDVFDRVTEDLRQPFYRYISNLFKSELAFREGRFEDASRLVPELTQAAAQTGRYTSVVAVAGQEWWLHWAQGVEETPDVLKLLEPLSGIPGFAMASGIAKLRLGNVRGAREIYTQNIEAALARQPTEWDFIISVIYLPELMLSFDDRGRMIKVIEALTPFRTLHMVAAITAPVVYVGPAALFLGMLETRLGRFDEAENDFMFALEMAARMRAVSVTAQTRMEYARMLLERNSDGDRERARAMLDRAVEEAQNMGFIPILEEARSLHAAVVES